MRPAVDLGAMSIVSKLQGKETQMGDCFIGEIGLAVKFVSGRVYDRVHEAENSV